MGPGITMHPMPARVAMPRARGLRPTAVANGKSRSSVRARREAVRSGSRTGTRRMGWGRRVHAMAIAGPSFESEGERAQPSTLDRFSASAVRTVPLTFPIMVRTL
jgi:hypothetical protein